MYETEQPAEKSGRRPPSFLPPKEWPEAGQWLERAIGLTKSELLNRLADLGVTSSSNRLKSYFTGERLPEPFTLEAICRAANLSYLEAVDRLGYYREIINVLDDLVWLGEQWLEEDDARGETLGRHGEELPRLLSLRSTGVVHWRGEPITWGRQLPGQEKPGINPERVPEFKARNIVGSWRQLEHAAIRVKFAPIDAVPGGTFRLTVPRTLDRVDQSLERETVQVPEETFQIILPKPIGVAIILGTLAFPRRGDVYKDGVRIYRERLGKDLRDLVNTARLRRSDMRAAGRPKSLHPVLQLARQTLDDSRLPFDYRRPVAGEYAVAWGDAICGLFTHFARLAAFEFWGGVGSEVSNVTSFSRMPQLRKAELPTIESLTTYN